jgi:hypothetical protein
MGEQVNVGLGEWENGGLGEEIEIEGRGGREWGIGSERDRG